MDAEFNEVTIFMMQSGGSPEYIFLYHELGSKSICELAILAIEVIVENTEPDRFCLPFINFVRVYISDGLVGPVVRVPNLYPRD